MVDFLVDTTTTTTANAENVRAALLTQDTEDNLGALRVARGTYDFGVSGGAQGTFALGPVLPTGAIVMRSGYDIVDAFTSGGAATVTLRYQRAVGPAYDDIHADAAFNHADYAAGIHVGAQSGWASPGTKVSAGGQLELTVTTADLTAGKVVAWCEYLVSD